MSATTPLVMPPAVPAVAGVDTVAARTDDPTRRIDGGSGTVPIEGGPCRTGGVISSANWGERDEIGRTETEAENSDEQNNANESEMADETVTINDDRTATLPTDADAMAGDARRRRAPAAAIRDSSVGSRPAGFSRSGLVPAFGGVSFSTSLVAR